MSGGGALVRLGYIDYLNLLPVYYGLETGRTRLDGALVAGPPTRVNALYRRGLLDVAPISSIEYARGAGDDVLLPGLSVCAWGHVQSILLFSRRSPDRLSGATVSFTASSATSVTLAQVLLRCYWQVDFTARTDPPDLDRMLAHADAALLIGDDALRAGLQLGVLPWREAASSRRVDRQGESLVVTDLGAVWWEYRGLPMVYAVFAAHGSEPSALEEAQEALLLSQAGGAADTAGMLRLASQSRGFSPEMVASYLLGSIRHDLGPTERQGLLAFYQEAAAIGAVRSVPGLRLAGAPTKAAT